MTSLICKTTKLAMEITASYVGPDDVAVDATAGNGNDTVALAGIFRRGSGKVYAFDLQEAALKKTREALLERGLLERVILICDSHDKIDAHVEEKGKVAAVVFNLGYLPSGDKTLTTKEETTLKAVEVALEIIKPGGIVTITMYSGHPSGKKEKEALLSLSRALPASDFHVCYANMLNQPCDPPEILWITKK